MKDIKFGTDGWRAVIAKDFTFANVARVAQATADYWRRLHAGSQPARGASAPKVVISYDRRFLSPEFARLTARVFAANGYQTVLTPEPTPTPALSYAVKHLGAIGGVMITASHNPPIYNGFKLKAAFGGSCDVETCQAVEALLDQSPARIDAENAASPLQPNEGIELLDIRPAYLRAIKRLVDFKSITRSRLRVAHDAMFGVGAGIFNTLLADSTCKVTTINGNHDVLFGGICPEPAPANYRLGAAFLRRHPHDICVVTDGDSDRIGAMDGRGNILTNQQVIALLLHHLVRNRNGRGTVIKTFNTTAMVDKMCAKWNLPLVEVGIGFRKIAPELMKPGALFGAEESGSVGFAGHIPERDGPAAALFLLEMLALEKKPVALIYRALEKEFGPHCYARLDVAYPLEKRAALMESLSKNPPARLLRQPLAKVDERDGVKLVARDETWLMLRGSGTEPVLRIYAEGKSKADRDALLQQGLSLLR
jgi:phosphomannomutase